MKDPPKHLYGLHNNLLVMDHIKIRWSKEEIETLRELWPSASLEELTKALPRRTLSAIRWKVHHLKIKSSGIRYKKTDEWKAMMSEIMRGPNNAMWKESGISLHGIHRWVRRHKPKSDLCEICGLVPPLDLANVSGEYRRDLDDYRWLCRKCHMESDGRLEALHKMNFARRRC